MAKKLNLLNIDNAIESNESTFTLTINDEWEIEIDNVFSKGGISSVVQNLAKNMEKFGTRAIPKEVLAPLFYILLIKEFTSLGEDIPDELQGQTEVVKKLIELDLFIPIVEAFPVDEVKKVVENIEQTTSILNESALELDKELKKQNIMNQEIKNKLKR